MKIRQILIIILSLTLILIIGFSFFIGKKIGINYGVEHAEEIRNKKKKSNTESNNVTHLKYVNVVEVKNQIFPIKLEGYGKVIAASSINISAEVQGKINTNIPLKKGTKFKKGQTLFTIKNEDTKLALQGKKSTFLTSLTAILPDLKIDFGANYGKWKKFYDQINVDMPLPPFPSFTSTKEKSFIISRNILSQYYSIKSDEERLKKYIVTAPFSGSIIESFSDDGAIVAPGMVVLKVIRDGKLEIEIPVLSKNIELIQRGQEVKLKANNDTILTGHIARIGNYVNPITQTIPVFVKIEASNYPLYNGMYLESTINCNSTNLAMQIPRTAIFGDEKAYVVNAKNELEEIKVNIITHQDKTVLVSGLEDGTKVVSEAIINIKEGSKVEILNK